MSQPIYNKKLTLPEFSDLSVLPDITQTSDLQFKALQPPDVGTDVRGMSEYELTQRASQDAKTAGAAQMTPEKRAHWARLENEYAAEKIRRKEQKDAEKKTVMTINQMGTAVSQGQITPERAAEVSKTAFGIDYTPEQYAKYLPTFRTERTPPKVMTVDEYTAMQQNQALEREAAEIDFLKAQAESERRIPQVSDLDIAKAESERRIPQVKPETITTTPEESLWERDPETGEWKQRVAGQAKLPTSKQYQVEYWDSAGVKQKRLVSEDEYDATMGNILDEGGSLSKPDKSQPEGYQESLVNAFADVKSGIKKEDVFRDLVVLFPEKTLELKRIFWPQTPLNLIIGE